MIQEIFAALVAFFLVEPMQGHIVDSYVANGMDREQATEIATCFTDQTPAILAQAGHDPMQAFTNAMNYWTGLSDIDAIVADMAPQCMQNTEVV
ncbi:hypothetical protein [Fodinicurvata sp. EGI_FJ10296]|uniref:hypothetical protein n=1 Tax=Fodinicurvata sp. EGI_FJ10296 TaxID=3231908 RepID=UPI003455BD74